MYSCTLGDRYLSANEVERWPSDIESMVDPPWRKLRFLLVILVIMSLDSIELQ